MNLQMEMEPTPEGRIAGKVMAILRHLKWNNHFPDHADFRDELRPIVQRELILAKLEALKIPKVRQDQERQRLTQALLELDC